MSTATRHAGAKYAALKRSQIIIRLLTVERRLLATSGNGRPSIKPGAMDRDLRKERAALFGALHAKDEEILAKWRAGYTYGHYGSGRTRR